MFKALGIICEQKHFSVGDRTGNAVHVYVGLQKQGMWAQSTPCLTKGHISIVEQNMFALQPTS